MAISDLSRATTRCRDVTSQTSEFKDDGRSDVEMSTAQACRENSDPLSGDGRGYSRMDMSEEVYRGRAGCRRSLARPVSVYVGIL